MAKKPAKKTSKAMSRKGMKKTKGGLNGMFSPRVQAVEYSPRDPAISGNVNGDGAANPGTLTTFTGGV